MKKIAFYGKGGIGKSTCVSNISMALAEQGFTVMQIGCDPKADSTRNLTHGDLIPSVLSVIREKKNDICLEDIVSCGSGGVLCVEAGGPKPGSGCAGRGIITAFEQLEELGAYTTYHPDIILYDVLGDVVCGGFALPIRQGYADEICIVTSGEMMSLYAADNISQAVNNYSKRGYAALKGLIYNAKNIENEDEIVEKAAAEMNTKVLSRINRDPIVQKAENAGMTVVEYAPNSSQADLYRKLAGILLED
ncbi:nitrogenase iron protein subunit NifH [Methanocorpusculum labreanum Z]|uniref:Nitrogenase iron protein subunit NifH n=1 Tax=Methanocorpusculum labreanum (strain ATCC 43576 / DSM 4855 / Z) TaxID=410358 RepID=A2SSA4_METLZ|nr:nitrogenase iron protein NifH [Methanocorpusculum labreanum]ABN07210.1 nitrogenase iron protein subunit NifH [Methanocorpusculum labreanum Z]